MRGAVFRLTSAADVMGLAQTWLPEGTGAISADLPVRTPNRAGGRGFVPEIQALLAAAGRASARNCRPPLSSERPRARWQTIR